MEQVRVQHEIGHSRLNPVLPSHVTEQTVGEESVCIECKEFFFDYHTYTFQELSLK